MTVPWGQARFPAPEFEHYTLPPMNLETAVYDPVYWRMVALLLFLVVTGFCFYRLRSGRLLSLLAVAGLLVFGYLFTACPCPAGMVQNVVAGLFSGTPASLGVLLLFTIPLGCALFFGRLFCAGACPLGAVQELLHWKTLCVPRPLDRVARMLPVLVLFLVSVMAASGMDFWLCYYEPYLPLFLLSFTFPLAWVTFAFLLLGLFVSRPFCRYVCPYGVLLRFFALFAVVKPRITRDRCIACKLCEQGCPNGAIVAPESAGPPEVVRRGVRRLSMLVALTPFALLIGGVLGYVAAPIISAAHPDVRLLRALDAGEQTLEVEAFESSGTSPAFLRKNVTKAQNRILLGMCTAGIVFAGCVMAELIAGSRRRREESEYTIDGSLCFCCGRCYRSCPVEIPRETVRE